MESEKKTTHKPMILAGCVVAGIGIGLLGHMMVGGGKAEGSESCAALDVAGLNKMVVDHANAINTGQVSNIMTHYNDEFIGINSMDVDWIMNRDAAMVSTNDFVKDKPTAQNTPKTQFIGCNVAWSIGERHTQWTDRATQAKVDRHARYTMIFRHGDKGWKISHLHFSVPVPLPTGPAAAAVPGK